MALEYLREWRRKADPEALRRKVIFGERKTGSVNAAAHIQVLDEDDDTLVVKFQRGPIKEAGANGAQVDDLIAVVREIVRSLDDQLPCKENKDCVAHLTDAMHALLSRRARREREGTEGTREEKEGA